MIRHKQKSDFFFIAQKHRALQKIKKEKTLDELAYEAVCEAFGFFQEGYSEGNTIDVN